MRMTAVFRTAFAAGLIAGTALPANAQIYEIVGTRAQGMAGAFVAVVDDATATWWNPAGLATGAYFSSVLERGRTTEPGKTRPGGPAWRGDTSAYAVVFPALGLSYYRLRISEIAPAASTADAARDRQDQGTTGIGVRSWTTSQFGMSVGQSLGNHLVIASTLKLVRGGLAVSSGEAAGNPLDAAADLDVSMETEADLDLGAMASFGHTRLGLAIKHARQPAFGEGANRLVLRRQVRAGMAFVARGTVTVAVDADLSKTATAFGDARHIAAGAEAWLLRRRVGLRGGVSANTVGETSTSTSTGVSLAVRSGTFVDAALTVGSDRSREGWNLGLRVTF
jgi:F plasmid transfer operon, TraF, protein